MNNLILSIENGNIVSRLNGLGDGALIASFVSYQQLSHIINAHNNSESLNPSRLNAKAIIG